MEMNGILFSACGFHAPYSVLVHKLKDEDKQSYVCTYSSSVYNNLLTTLS